MSDLLSPLPLPVLAAFAALCLGMVLTPGPNMAYLVSRSICQGRTAGLVSLAGVGLGFVIFLTATVLGLSAMMAALPLTFEVIRWAGAAYLVWLAWNALRPGGHSPFQVRDLPPDSGRRLFTMGLVTNLLNPKAAMLYLSLLPQFIDPARGSVLVQGLMLGAIQITISLSVNAVFVMIGGGIARFLDSRPLWARVQRMVMGSVLAGLAAHMAMGR
ncbi:lysine transporter LysE [Niveispirillum lacus]|uniref:Lysine transporter LysE n=1 Tax=Niveispirillum lacus TaxID=1981099 RepID=A0A255YWS7_9PROT|nr:LysE family translocator [Niveispirillum lacus]OYQ33697.1 lysine transporter LysE [Niveispirillum lacus]